MAVGRYPDMEPSTKMTLGAFKGMFCMKVRLRFRNSHFGLMRYLK